MRAALGFCLFGLSLFLAGIGSAVAAQLPTPQETAQLDVVSIWKIVNTAIFAVGLGYLTAKYAPAFFNARSFEIQKAIKDAMGLKIEAEFRASEIDRKMAELPDEVNKLRQQYAEEMEREHERFRHETQAELDHIQRHVAAEIEAFRLEGARQVRRHTAQLALASAERRLRDRLTSESQDDFVRTFANLVERSSK